MTYVQFYQRGVITGNLIPACGSDSVEKLDGRQTVHNLHVDAKERTTAHARKHPAYRLFRGRTYSQSEPISKIVEL